MFGMLKFTNNVQDEIREVQKSDLRLTDQLLLNQGKETDFRISKNGVMSFRDRVCVLDLPELKKKILEVGHKIGLSIHSDATTMYQGLKKKF